MKNKLSNLRFKITLLDKYIIKELIPNFVFSLTICSILGELIGISFEQIGFAFKQDLPKHIVVYIHWLKLPAFVNVALPFALLISTIIIYTNLSNKNEIIAFQTVGISLYRLIVPVLAIAIISTIIMFVFQELVIPPANYQAAMILERELNIDRTQLAKYNKKEIIYQEFETDNHLKHLKLLFFAESFDGKKMNDITLVKLQNKQIKEIVIARSAQWNEQKKQWELFSGRFNLLSSNNTNIISDDFNKLSLKLSRKILDYVNHHRDNREMNINDLYKRLAIVKHTGNAKKIRELQISIQERYAAPVSCLIFTFLGSTLGISSFKKSSFNSLGIAAIVICVYYSTQFLSNALSVAEVIPIFWGVWFPNFFGLAIGWFILKFKC